MFVTFKCGHGNFNASQSLLEKEVHWIDSSARRFRGNSIVADLLSVTGSVIALQSCRSYSKTHCLQVFRGSLNWVDLYTVLQSH